MLYKDWLKEWLECYVKHSSKQRTYIRYYEIVYRHVVPSIGDYEINDLTPFILQGFITKQLQNGNLKTGVGLAVNSVNAIITVIQSSLKVAAFIGNATSYIGDKIMRPKNQEKQVVCFTIAEQHKIERAIFESKSLKMYGVLICLYTGLRIGELLALEWDDVKFEKEIISVSKTSYEIKDENGHYVRIVGTPKTKSAERIIPLPKQLVPYLKKLHKQNKSQYVIESDEHKAISIRSYQRSFELLLKRLSIPHKGFHSLRHTFATRAIECGVDVKTLSEILGHKDPTITLKRYVHSLTDHKKKMMNMIGKLLE